MSAFTPSIIEFSSSFSMGPSRCSTPITMQPCTQAPTRQQEAMATFSGSFRPTPSTSLGDTTQRRPFSTFSTLPPMLPSREAQPLHSLLAKRPPLHQFPKTVNYWRLSAQRARALFTFCFTTLPPIRCPKHSWITSDCSNGCYSTHTWINFI